MLNRLTSPTNAATALSVSARPDDGLAATLSEDTFAVAGADAIKVRSVRGRAPLASSSAAARQPAALAKFGGGSDLASKMPLANVE